MPRLISFVTDNSSEDPENARALIIHALTTFVSTVARLQKGAAMAMLVPALLKRANTEGEGLYRETSARLLELAGYDPVAFKSVIGGMTEGQKAFLESVILAGRQGGNVQALNGDDKGREPTIALRMDFGG